MQRRRTALMLNNKRTWKAFFSLCICTYVEKEEKLDFYFISLLCFRNITIKKNNQTKEKRNHKLIALIIMFFLHM